MKKTEARVKAVARYRRAQAKGVLTRKELGDHGPLMTETAQLYQAYGGHAAPSTRRK